MEDPRRRIPRTDALLELPEVRQWEESLGRRRVRDLIRATQEAARRAEIAVEEVEPRLLEALWTSRGSTLRSVINATGVIIHTNLGRAPLGQAAVEAVVQAAGYVDLEMDLTTGTRSSRGAAARAALRHRCPEAEEVLIVNNGAAALMLAAAALAPATEIIISRGELIEIGAGFRLTELMASTGAVLREVGTTNRTHREDYASAIGPQTGMLMKVHPSNYRIEGFTAEVTTEELSEVAAAHQVPLVVDIGSGLLAPEPLLPAEPDAASMLQAGADVVIASGDKLLGGPQAGIVLGRSEAVRRMARHPMARAVRADKLTLAALEATLQAGQNPVQSSLHADRHSVRQRTEHLAAELDVTVVSHDGRVGGGGGAGVPLPGCALALPEAVAPALRLGEPAVLPRLAEGACLVDLRCVPVDRDAELLHALRHAMRAA